MKKITLILLVALLIQASACSNVSDDDKGNESISQNQTDDTELSDGLGEYDFGNAEFNIVTCEAFFFSPYDPEEENGDILNDAAYKRNRTVEDRFNCQINYTMLQGSSHEAADEIRQSTMAGDSEYQLGIVHCYDGLKGLIADGLVLDWNKVENVDFSNPWWNSSFNSTLSIENILPCASSDFIYFNSGCIYFNKDLAEKYEIESPYQLVYDGKWTWDKLDEIALTVADDLDGDGFNGDNDQYGYSIIKNHRMVPVTYSYGISPSSKDDDGYITLDNLGSEKMNTIVQNYYELLFENQGAIALTSDELVPFRNGKVLFLHYVTQNIQALRDIEWDFGILPMPKYNEEQEEYYSLAQSCVMVIPATETDTEFVGTIIEALSADSYYNVLPALYDVSFNNKYLRDDDSIKMFDIIKNSLIYDPIWNYNTSNNISFFLTILIDENSANTASYYAANHESAEEELRDFFDKVKEAYAD